jgi:hypothetical protein
MLALFGLCDWIEGTLEPSPVWIMYVMNTGITGIRLLAAYVLVRIVRTDITYTVQLPGVLRARNYIDAENSHTCMQDLFIRRHDCPVIVRSRED